MHPGRKAKPYFGSCVASFGVSHAQLIEARYCADLQIPEHSHDTAYLSLVLEGSYTEHVGGASHSCSAGTAIFHPEGERHSDCFANQIGRLFMIEPCEPWLRRCQDDHIWLERRIDCHGPIALLASRIYNEARTEQLHSRLVIEGLLLELAAVLGRAPGNAGSRPPTWLVRVLDRLREEYSRAPRMDELAAFEGVHPVELARSFRRHFGCTAGEYLRHVRIDAARRLLRTSDRCLAALALDLGFASQSHFCTSFRRLTGYTPQQYRRQHQSVAIR
jgi:AraC family transcriptional regulator